jgi:aryl-alcohol dehydrogenase-like predicted oxidoreductase
MELILGTANFGTVYGVANNQEKMTRRRCHEVLDFAYSSGVGCLDTAKNYGDSESIIGEFHRAGRTYKVFSKVSDFNTINVDDLVTQARLTIQRLQIEKLSGFYFHNSRILHDFPPSQINAAIKHLVDSGFADKVGVSVYDEAELIWVAKTFPRIQLFQVPENVLDRRLLDSKLVRELYESGCEFHVRSIFLQGLLLMEPGAIPTHLQKAAPAIESLQIFSKNQGMSVLQVCLSYLSLINWASSFVIGVTNVEQLKSILLSKSTVLNRANLPPQLSDFILDPRNWALK